MIRLTNEGHKMGDALEAARKDTVIKERHFITPTSLAALVVAQKRDDRSRSPRGGQQGGGWHGRDWHGDWHRGKHGGYGKGKGPKGKQLRHQTAERSAGSGTLSMRGAGSTAAGCINARYALGATQCTHAHKESRKALRKTLRGVERMSDRQWSRGMPQPRHEPNKEAMRGPSPSSTCFLAGIATRRWRCK